MKYTDSPAYCELEREAYTRGDTLTAELAAAAMDGEAAQAKADELDYKLERIEALITGANWRTGKKAELRDLIEAIAQEVKPD